MGHHDRMFDFAVVAAEEMAIRAEVDVEGGLDGPEKNRKSRCFFLKNKF
jgi:hypothetical protein